MACIFVGDDSSTGSAADVTPVVEKEYVEVSEVSSSSSSYRGSYGVHGGGMVEEEEEELQLGLSLGSRKKMATGTEGERRGSACWERSRILTAEDLRSMGSRVGVPSSPVSSSSSFVSSSSPTPADGGNGEKRITDNPPGSHMVVGWPPVRAYRINSLVNQSKDNAAADRKNKMTDDSKICKTAESFCPKDNENKARFAGNSLLVKVNLDGDQIGRKVNLSAHLSYETLALALETMFYKLRPAVGVNCNTKRTSSLLDGSSGFALTYEDKDGDWMLVGDVPWGMFLSTVKRIRIMRNPEIKGLATRFPSSLAGIKLGRPA